MGRTVGLSVAVLELDNAVKVSDGGYDSGGDDGGDW